MNVQIMNRSHGSSGSRRATRNCRNHHQMISAFEVIENLVIIFDFRFGIF